MSITCGLTWIRVKIRISRCYRAVRQFFVPKKLTSTRHPKTRSRGRGEALRCSRWTRSTSTPWILTAPLIPHDGLTLPAGISNVMFSNTLSDDSAGSAHNVSTVGRSPVGIHRLVRLAETRPFPSPSSMIKNPNQGTQFGNIGQTLPLLMQDFVIV